MQTWSLQNDTCTVAVIILGMGSANERQRYIVSPSLIGWAHLLHCSKYSDLGPLLLTWFNFNPNMDK